MAGHGCIWKRSSDENPHPAHLPSILVLIFLYQREMCNFYFDLELKLLLSELQLQEHLEISKSNFLTNKKFDSNINETKTDKII